MFREGHTPFTSVFTVKLLGRLDETRLRRALACVQAKHPLLRCVIDNMDGFPRFVLQDRPEAITLRIVERHSEGAWQIEIRREWMAPFDASRAPLVRFVWVRGEDLNELILVGHHCICDGASGINLLRECLYAYDRPERDLGTYETLGAIEDIIPAAVLQSRRFRRRVRRKVGLLRLALFLKGRGSRKRINIPISVEQMYFHRWHVDEATTRVLIERCRAEGVTVLAAVSVAFMQAFRDVRGIKALRKTYSMVDARRFLPQMRKDVMFGLAPSVTLRMKGLPPPWDIVDDGFWARVRLTKADLTRRIDRLGIGFYEYLVGLEALHDQYARFVTYFDNAPVVRHVTLSNMGRLDLPQEYQNFRLEKIYSPLVMVSPTPANTVIISSFAGEMEFAIVSDEQSLPREQALAIEERAMEILHTCITISGEHKVDLASNLPMVREKTI